MSSIVFVISALEAIAASKESHKRHQLRESVQNALQQIKEHEPQLPDPEIIFAPLQLATRSSSIPLTTTALDCIGKLISYSYFSVPSSPNADKEVDRAPLIERAIDTICDCFQGETTPVEVQLQIVKSLLAAVLNDKIVVHGAGLLKAVRQVYNVFLLSKNSANQQVAQGTLTQMVGTVFERVKTRIHMKEARQNLSKLAKSPGNNSSYTVDTTNGVSTINEPEESVDENSTSEVQSGEDGPKLTLKDLEHRKSFDDSQMGEGPTMVTQVKAADRVSRSISEQTTTESTDEGLDSDETEDEVYIRDAYLVFRSFCNLSTKILGPDQLYDLKGQAMRSKLISLHLIHTLLNNNILVFTSPLCTITNSKSNEPTGFLQAIKFYLCLSITRNGASSVDRVFEVCCEIFWLMLKFMRAPFKKEIEVFLNEIYLALLERRNAPVAQKLYFMGILHRFCADPRALVETYLNYDCDRNVDNMFQTLIEDFSKAASAAVMISPIHQQQYEERNARNGTNGSEWQVRGTLPPPLSTAQIDSHHQNGDSEIPKEYIVKRQALDCLVETLRSLVNWSQQGIADVTSNVTETETRQSEDFRESIDPSINDNSSRALNSETTVPSTPVLNDEFEQLEKEKQRKTAMTNAIKQFNFKPKRGIKLLLTEGFIPTESPEDIARFLLREERLDKAQIGEFLGEGEEKNIAIMHAFVDGMEFTKRRFVDALRQFLQSFRLPGEAQKIDRFMLKFANRYVTGNPDAFANADTAYVLAYSVILLNTDLHSSKVAKRMTKQDFIKNNRGINDNANLPDDYLVSIYDEIANDEIVLRSEREAAAAMGITPQQSSGGIAANLGQAFATVGRDLQREAYLQQSEEISHRSEQLFKNLFRNQRKNSSKSGAIKFIPATSFKHVGPMFDVTWMSFFSGLSGQMQNSQNIEIIKTCMEGMKLAVRIACLFDLETPREAFVSALKNATNLNNPTEMMAKNVEAVKVLLEIAQAEGNLLRGSWRDILMCVSQLDRLQLISDGVDETAIPDVSKARIVPPSRQDSSSRKSTQSVRSPRPRPRSTTSGSGYSLEIAMESRSDEVIKAVDRIFTSTANLSGDAIVFFVQALTDVSWEEIKISGSNESPRTYSLQKLVEISYYNMTRVRFEWTNIWAVLGEHFNRVGCHNNTAVVYFALDSLRQLSMRFMEIEELPGFKFQKDFLKPFEHIIANSSVVTVKDMTLRCLIQMIQARGENIRSGWRTMFGVFTVAAREPYESIVNLAFDNVNQVYKTRFGVVISQGAFADLIVCLTEFSKNMKFQKKGLQAMETLKSIIPKMLKTPECPLSNKSNVHSDGSVKTSDNLDRQLSRTSQEEAFWFPVLFAFHDVLMTGEDLEIRSNSLNYLFDSLIKYGGDFPPDFWDILWRQLLYPIFMVLKSNQEMSNSVNQEELSVWLSTTMIQALRNMITLFTHYFDSLEYMLDRFLDLLALCICQENDTIARIGSNCLQQLILQNVTKFRPEHWSKIVGAFVELFDRTTAYQLFSAVTTSTVSNGLENIAAPLDDTGDEKSLKINGTSASTSTSETSSIVDDEGKTPTGPTNELEDYRPQSGLQQQPVVVTSARRKFFNKIITRCVLQLLMIETVNELFSNDAVYAKIPSPELLRLMGILKKSFLFAKKFNENKDLRMRLWREGFMKQPPNLLKQESGSAATYISILLRMYHDEGEERKRSRSDIEQALVPLCEDILRGFTELEDESQQRNIIAWRPVVVDVIEGYTNFPQEGFSKHIEIFFPLAVDLLNRDLGMEIRLALQGFLRRVGEVKLGLPQQVRPGTPTSPAASTHSGFTFRGKRRGTISPTGSNGSTTVSRIWPFAAKRFVYYRVYSPSVELSRSIMEIGF
ncbi:hypothetical protein B7494_g7382 [Chlorociboria aeruginascens]|nr:hypothetical protein B7494_g7382 [Chlorociboria aeruginascens]